MRVAAFALLILFVGLLAFLADSAFEIPVDGGLQSTDPLPSAVVVKAADGSELATRGRMRGDVLTADEFSPNLKQAIVAIEDRRFYDHGALDVHGMVRAVVRDIFTSRRNEGASTITQQLARLLLLSPERSLRRKAQEALIAAWLEHHLTKQQILARYLNSAYFGAGAYGADAAARRYFDKSARSLSLAEAAMIAGLVRAPSQLAPHRKMDAARARAQLVLLAMASTGAISRQAADDAVAHPAELKVAPEAPSGSGYVADSAAGDVKTLVGDAAVDLTAQTTVDPDLQAAAEKAVEDVMAKQGDEKNASQAALVATAPDGAILAMVGGRDYDKSSFNRATRASRQAGSTFKLFVYLSALQKGMSPDTLVVDRPVKIGDWEPQNYESRFRGTMPLKTAFATSANTVAAQLGQQVGIKTVIKTAHDLGVQSTLPDVPSLALGTAGVNLSEMTRAFATVASDQDTVEPYLVRRITARDKVLFNRPAQYAEDADPSPAKLAMRDLLAEVVRNGTGKAAQLPFATGGKTGTTQDFRDAWFIGSAPDITVGVWVGNDDNSPMNGVTGGDLPAQIWRAFVAAAEKKLNAQSAKQARNGAQARAAKPAAPAPSKQAQVAKQVPTAPTPQGAPPTEPGAQRHDGKPNDPAQVATQEPKQDDPSAAGAEISGDADVVNTSTLDIDGQEVHLEGVAPLSGRPARALARHLRRHEVTCRPASNATSRCSVEGDDLATVILANGGASATPDAPPDLMAAQDAAQAGRRGIWRHRR